MRFPVLPSALGESARALDPCLPIGRNKKRDMIIRITFVVSLETCQQVYGPLVVSNPLAFTIGRLNRPGYFTAHLPRFL